MNKEENERITYEEFMIMFKNAPRLAYMLYDKAEDEIDRLNNVINELEKWLKEYADKDTMSSIIFGVVLNHLIDLKGENNEKD